VHTVKDGCPDVFQTQGRPFLILTQFIAATESLSTVTGYFRSLAVCFEASCEKEVVASALQNAAEAGH
jgi:hypothetical protein